jgi:acyl-coenzyme A thioesterase PaaI-like protein
LNLIDPKDRYSFTPLEIELRALTESAVHGGLILSLTDTLGSLAVASKGQYMTGVSTDIGTSFVRPAGQVGDILHAKGVLTGIGELVQADLCKVLMTEPCKSIGRSLAYTRVDFTNSTGELVAYGCKLSLFSSSVYLTDEQFT